MGAEWSRACVAVGILLAACSGGDQSASPARPPNLLLILADDVGVDRIASYGEHPRPGRTPNIDALAAEGVLFRNAWANPTCSGSRATILTGRYALRTGLGAVLKWENPNLPGLALSEVTLAEALRAGSPSYRSAVIGKWHLADPTQGPRHPLEQGFDHHRGSLYNLNAGANGCGGEDCTYVNWTKYVDGVEELCRVYATTDTVDDAIEFVRAQPAGQPWFLYVPFNAPHRPFHAPPPHLHGAQLSGAPETESVAHVLAAIEAMDTEIGRLLAAVPRDETIVVFLADNGTAKEATEAPFDREHSKRSPYEGGVNVPLIVAGPGIATAEVDALVNTTDLFSTFIELAGAPEPEVELDSVSLVPYLEGDPTPRREWVYSERFFPNGAAPYAVHVRAIRDTEGYKLVIFDERRTERRVELYDLTTDPWEKTNLAAQGRASLSGPPAKAYDRLLHRAENL